MGRGAGLRVDLDRSIRVARVRRGKIGLGRGVLTCSSILIHPSAPALRVVS
jgi:hypothetical protein